MEKKQTTKEWIRNLHLNIVIHKMLYVVVVAAIAVMVVVVVVVFFVSFCHSFFVSVTVFISYKPMKLLLY